MITQLPSLWHQHFGDPPPEIIVRAPGRVNIIGEHTDYNEGWVLPGAMSRSIYILMSKNRDTGHHWIADDLKQHIQSTQDIFEYGQYAWSRYIEGAIRLYAPDIGPLKMLIVGDLPVGAGISSSSALVCGVLFGLQHLTGRQESRKELALLSSRVEREVIGLQGGIMDQFAIMLSEKDKVMLLDCRAKTYEHIDAGLPGCKWLLINTMVRHALIDSDYNTRASECAQALRSIRTTFPEVHSLRDTTLEQLESVQLPQPLYDRARFVIEENIRVHRMVQALRHHDAVAAGLLLQQSHEGLRDKYQVSCEELDHLAEYANTTEGVLGARMMGGGFGGCVLCLVREEKLVSFLDGCSNSYMRRFGFPPEVIRFELGGGVELVRT